MFNGRYEDAINNFKKSLNLSPNDVAAHVNLAVAYIKAGQEDKAREAVANITQLNPKASLLDMKRLVNYRNQANNDMYMDALRRAGMPEHPPLPLPDKPSVAVLPFVQQNGFDGGRTIVTDYVRKIRPPKTKPYLKLVFAPGECAQVDWDSYGNVWVESTSRRLSFFCHGTVP